MSLTFTKVADSDNVVGKHRTTAFDVTLDNSYTTGGYAITAANIGLRRIISAREIGGNAAAAILNFHWDNTAGKLFALYPTGGTTAPAALADPIVTTGASTASAVDATTPHVTPGRAKEVAASTDLSTIVVRMEFVGE